MSVDTMTLVDPGGMEVPTIFEVFAPVANGDAGSACRLRIRGAFTMDRSIPDWAGVLVWSEAP